MTFDCSVSIMRNVLDCRVTDAIVVREVNTTNMAAHSRTQHHGIAMKTLDFKVIREDDYRVHFMYVFAQFGCIGTIPHLCTTTVR